MRIIKDLIKRVFQLLGYKISQLKEEDSLKVSLNMLLGDLLLKQEDLFFVQVGAYDGKSNDPIYEIAKKCCLKGVLIEPQISAFEKLKENYSNSNNLIFLNVAISDNDGFKVMYKVSGYPEAPYWLEQLTSFSRETILKHGDTIPNIENLIVEQEVRTISPITLVNTYNIKEIDVLIIDTEGFDFEIIKLFDSTGIKPKIIFFESRHLGDNYYKCLDFLQVRNYKLSHHEGDSIALLSVEY